MSYSLNLLDDRDGSNCCGQGIGRRIAPRPNQIEHQMFHGGRDDFTLVRVPSEHDPVQLFLGRRTDHNFSYQESGAAVARVWRQRQRQKRQRPYATTRCRYGLQLLGRFGQVVAGPRCAYRSAGRARPHAPPKPHLQLYE